MKEANNPNLKLGANILMASFRENETKLSDYKT